MRIVPRVMALQACHRQSLLTCPRDWKLVVAACGRLFLKNSKINLFLLKKFNRTIQYVISENSCAPYTIMHCMKDPQQCLLAYNSQYYSVRFDLLRQTDIRVFTEHLVCIHCHNHPTLINLYYFTPIIIICLTCLVPYFDVIKYHFFH